MTVDSDRTPAPQCATTGQKNQADYAESSTPEALIPVVERELPKPMFDDNRHDDRTRFLPGALGRLAEDAQETRDIASGVATLLKVLDWDQDLRDYQQDTDPGEPLEASLFSECTRANLMQFAIASIQGLAHRADKRLDAIRGGATFGHP